MLELGLRQEHEAWPLWPELLSALGPGPSTPERPRYAFRPQNT